MQKVFVKGMKRLVATIREDSWWFEHRSPESGNPNISCEIIQDHVGGVRVNSRDESLSCSSGDLTEDFINTDLKMSIHIHSVLSFIAMGTKTLDDKIKDAWSYLAVIVEMYGYTLVEDK